MSAVKKILWKVTYIWIKRWLVNFKRWSFGFKELVQLDKAYIESFLKQVVMGSEEKDIFIRSDKVKEPNDIKTVNGNWWLEVDVKAKWWWNRLITFAWEIFWWWATPTYNG